ncbi:MAG: methionyl-tRNA formyltransferase [Verrucomicrobiota bacterium]
MRVLFVGTGDIGVPTLEWLLKSRHEVLGVVTQPDKPVGRHQELQASRIKQIAIRENVPLFQPRKIREAGVIEEICAYAPQVIVVIAYGQILSRAFLDIPSLACLNLHASMLPRHRGAAPIQAVIEAGDAETAMAVMYMAEGLDTGDVLMQRKIRLKRRETGGSLHDRLALIGPEVLSEALDLLGQGTAPRTPQIEADATYAGKLTREHGEISWRSSAEVDRKVRAMNPWPGAYTWLPMDGGRKKLKVFSVIQSRTPSGGMASGTILASEKRGILVAAGERSVWLTEVQLEGKKRMRASEFIRGTSVKVGIVCGTSTLP